MPMALPGLPLLGARTALWRSESTSAISSTIVGTVKHPLGLAAIHWGLPLGSTQSSELRTVSIYTSYIRTTRLSEPAKKWK